ncbi:hypothetical protein I6G76_29755 (plasmid) [Bacillus cereus]|uniref:Uncharacterized protein n=1 Tax=Bacillus cereus (strain ZK / E33L) TaxID=288681 RepID=Q4V0Z4_BACCZ|nr:hypothetical protein [Bacillus cereus]AAY60613.1 hypothetical protein pE33L54_0007 [Bacillus cereus E33L]AJI25886.1 hypothetical protein BF28_5957 [Bacillus cereus E33L]QQA24534.1 hypothetical protein I6G76_29755 [Bacillus cereus]
MKKGYQGEIEKITICIGFAILALSLLNVHGALSVTPAFVTGISLAGCALSFADYTKVLIGEYDGFITSKITSFTVSLMYLIAALSLICLPYTNTILSMKSSVLDKLSTSSSLLALGCVFITIGHNNRKRFKKKAIEQITNQNKRFEKDKYYEEILEQKNNKIKELEKFIQEFEKTKDSA